MYLNHPETILLPRPPPGGMKTSGMKPIAEANNVGDCCSNAYLMPSV